MQRGVLHPHLGVDRGGALAQEREVALVHLREMLVRRPGHIEVRREGMVRIRIKSKRRAKPILPGSFRTWIKSLLRAL